MPLIILHPYDYDDSSSVLHLSHILHWYDMRIHLKTLKANDIVAKC